jgi:type VI secretion system secreted protein VgrG
MAKQARAVLDLRIGDIAAADLRVTAVRGEEALSEPYRFEVDFERVDGEPVELADLLGKDASLSLRWQDGSGRDVHGIADLAALTGASRRPRYRVRIVPRLALLARGGGNRIFQGKAAPAVVEEVLKKGGVAHRLELRGAYPPREYCLQWRESDLAFASRLLAEEGISFRFEHGPDAHELVLLDAPDAFAEAPGDPLPFRGPRASLESEGENLTGLFASHRLRTDHQVLRDYDELRPELLLDAQARAGDAPSLEAYDYQLAYADSGELGRLAAARLEAGRVAAHTVEGEAVSLRILPGVRIEVVEHPSLDGKLQVLRAVHEASQAETIAAVGGGTFSYRCRFLAQPAGDPIRPPRPPPRAAARGVQSAVVVGPPGEEIHTDAHGRIKVQLRWDREGKRDDHSSAFVRVAQPWAGPGQGTLRLPRAGQEVLVRFLGGDPDRPLVVGALYHGSHPPPVALPGEKTQSVFRSESSPGGGGANELRLEDAAGAEELYLHAQKNLTIAVENDEEREVGHEAWLSVGKDRKVEVGKDQELRVGAADRAVVEGSQTLTVTRDRIAAVARSHTETVGVAAAVNVGGAQVHTTAFGSAVVVGAAASLAVGGALAVTVGGAATSAVGGASSLQVGGDAVEAVGANRSETVGGPAERKVGGDEEVEVKEGAHLHVEKDLDEKVEGKVEIESVEPAAWLGKKLTVQADELCLEVGDQLLSR